MSKSISCLLPLALLAVALPAVSAPPANDACPAATAIPALELPFTQALDTTQATTDGDPAVPCIGPPPGKSVWYTFTPATSEVFAFDATASTPSEYATVLALYEGVCGGLAPVANGCARGRLVASLTAGTTYHLLVAGEAVVVDPGIRIALNGVDLCPSGPGPGGGDCGTTFFVRVGDQLAARAYNQLNGTLLTAGAFGWSLGTNASPATASGPSAAFSYTAPVESTNVVLTWTPPGQDPISRQVTMNVAAAAPASVAGPGPFPLAAGETATLPSPGGVLRLTVQRDAPEWRFAYIVPSVASILGAGGVPFVSDLSVATMETTETVVGLELWTAEGRREASLITLPARGSRTIPDVVKNAFGLEQTFGALVVSATGRVSAGARTWAPVPGGGSNGQFALAGDVRNPTSAAILATGEVGVFPGVRQDAAFRTNVGVYNLGATECVVEVEARDEQGMVVGSKLALTVPPTRYVQEPLSKAVGNALPSGSVLVTNATAGCSVGGVAYVIDNVTQDPFVVSQRKKP
ncbi:MAG: hypothetical protein KJ062_16010 [Thermoanaerobaculia bacterium]|nr:hypothetical protein [Thermoanaerobaculia bacterium]